jgi:hypothetical protein
VRLYLDANALIYGVEGPGHVRAQVLDWVDRCEATIDGVAVTSDLSRLECRVKPMRAGDLDALARFDSVFGAGNLLVVDVTPRVVERATQIRAQHGFRTPRCPPPRHGGSGARRRILTSDQRLRRFPDLSVTELKIQTEER